MANIPTNIYGIVIVLGVLILVAGPTMNLLIALAFMTALNMSGVPVNKLPAKVGRVKENTPAARAGFLTGDVIVAVDGQPVDDFDDMRLIVSTHAGTPLRF